MLKMHLGTISGIIFYVFFPLNFHNNSLERYYYKLHMVSEGFDLSYLTQEVK